MEEKGGKRCGGGVRGRRGGKRRGKVWRSEGRREGEHTTSISSGSTLYPHCCGRPSREKSLRIEKKVTLQIMHYSSPVAVASTDFPLNLL